MPVVDRFDIPASSSGDPLVDRFDEPPIDYTKLGEFDAAEATEGQKWRLALGYLTTPNANARADIIRKVLPGARIEKDPNNGRPIVSFNGEVGYIDKPGVSLGGFLDGVAQVAKFIPAGKVASLGATALTKIGIAGAGGVLMSAGEDVAAIPQGSEQGVSPEKAVISGVAAAAGQALAPAVGRGIGWLTDKGSRVWQAMRGVQQAVTPDGTLTEIGRKIATDAGLDPDQITPQLASELERAAKQATSAALPDEQLPGAIQRQALSKRFKVPLTRGETLDDYAQQSLEENLRRMDVTTKAGNIMRTAEKDAAAKLRGDSGESGFGLLKREISPRPSADIVDAGQQVIGSTQTQAAVAKSTYQGAYRTAREAGAALDARNYKQFLTDTETVLKDAVDYDPNLYPQTAKVIENLRGRLVFMEETATANADDFLSPKRVLEIHPVKDVGKFEQLSKSMSEKGWQGRPVLVFDNGNGVYALTGSHRLAAAKAAGIDVPVVYANNELVEAWAVRTGNTIDDLIGVGDDRVFSALREMGDSRAAKLMLKELRGSSPKQKPIPLAKLENIRKIINTQWKSADATDRMGLDVLRNQFDEMVNGAIDEGRIVGDNGAVESWKQGRELYSRFQQLYRPNPQGGQAEKQAGRVVENWLKSDAVNGEDVIRQAVSNRALTARLLAINGVDSPAHVALKQGVLEYAFRPALKSDSISPRLIVSQYDRFFKGANKEQMQAVFSQQELTAIREFVELSKAKIPQQGVVNFSNTGNVLIKAVQQLGQKLGILGAATGHIETAAALGAVNAASNAASTAQARAAVRGLVPVNRVSVPAVGASAAVGSAIGAHNDE